MKYILYAHSLQDCTWIPSALILSYLLMQTHVRVFLQWWFQYLSEPYWLLWALPHSLLVWWCWSEPRGYCTTPPSALPLGPTFMIIYGGWRSWCTAQWGGRQAYIQWLMIYCDEAAARAVESLWKECFVADSLIPHQTWLLFYRELSLYMNGTVLHGAGLP